MEDQLAIITTYINPHVFWILFEKDREKLIDLEKSMLKNKNTIKEKTHASPKELVAINHNKIWKRALIQNSKEASKYECWLIDYGETLTTERIYELPKIFITQPPFAQPSCLYNIVPLRNSFNVELAKPLYEKQLNFSPGTIKVVGEYIRKASSITFRLHKIINGVFCGSLLLKVGERAVDLIEELVKENHVAFDTELFLQALKENIPMLHCYLPYVNSIIQNSDSLENTDEFSLTRGRGYHRNLKKDAQIAGISKSGSVTKWLVHNKTKDEPASLRPPSKCSLVSMMERTSPRKSDSSTSSERDGVSLEKRYSTSMSMKEIKDCLETKYQRNRKLEDLSPSQKSSSTQNVAEKCSPSNLFKGNSVRGDQEAEASPKSNKSCGNDAANSSTGSFDLKTFVKGRGKSKQTSTKPNESFSPNRNDFHNTSTSSTPANAYSIKPSSMALNGQYSSDGKMSRIKARASLQYEDNKWEDVEDSDNYSQNTTDYSLNKSSFEDSSDDPLRKTKSPLDRRPHSDASNFKKRNSKSSDCNDDKKSSSSVLNSSESDNEISLTSIRTKLKVGCQCEECRKWDADDFAEKAPSFAELKRKPKKIACKPPPLFKNESSLGANVEMQKVLNSRTKIEKDIAPCLLVHSLHIPSPVSGVVDVAFCNPIHNALNYLKFKAAYTIQSYAWPAVMRLMNTCLVGSPNSGKTMCYLPAMCSFVIEKESRFCNLPKENGPLVVVLCESLYKVEETYNIFVTVLKHTRERVKIAYILPPLEKSYLKHIKSSDILIATSKMLIHLLSSRIINFKRLCHLVVERADKMLSKYPNEFDSITKGIQSMLEHRVCFYGVQVIAVAETWTRKLEAFLKKLDSEPIICISNYLQCAIYAQTPIRMRFEKIPNAKVAICNIVKEKSGALKTVIVCNDDTEVLDVGRLLQVEGASVTIMTSNMMTEEICEEEQSWNSTAPGRHSVLICTDVTLSTQLSITQAEILIHYSLPKEHWTVFSKRFKCLLDNYDCPLNTKFQPGKSCESHVFVNDNCLKQYPRLCDFLTTMGTQLTEKYINLSKSIKENEEQTKIQDNILLCKKLKLLGNCNIFRCKKRHTLSDSLDVLDWVPASGRIKFKLLNIRDATVFGVRIVEHMDTKRNVHKMTDHTKFLTDGLKRDVNKLIYPISIVEGKLYAWYDEEGDIYHRCKVLKTLHEYKITKRASEVCIRLIDGGKETKVSTGNLFDLPKQYMDLPPQSVDVHLANIVPLDEDENWCARVKIKVSNILSSVDHSKENSYFVGRIVLQIGDSLWLDDIEFHEDLEYARETVALLVLKRKMLNLQMCSYREEQLNDLYKHCENCGINLPSYVIEPPKVAARSSQVKPQWAFLEEGYNVVYFSSAECPDQFYIRLQKFHKIFLQLQSDIQDMIKKPFYPEIKEVIVGNCYLAQDPGGQEYGRVIIRAINDEMVDCFFVDFGDYVMASKNELKFLPDEAISRLPCQAIECSLYGVQPILDNWVYEANDVFYNHCLDNDNCNNIFKNLYTQYFKSEKSSDKGRNIYSVAMFECSTYKPTYVNKLLIDCGYALNVENEDLSKVIFPEIKLDDEDENDVNNDEEEEIVMQPYIKDDDDTSSDIGDESDTWDVCINDKLAFFKECFSQNMHLDDAASGNGTSTPTSHHLKPMKALPPVNYYTPDVTWYQTNQLIKLDILLSDVQDYSILVLRKNIFSFSTIKNDKEYKLYFQLFKTVNSTFQHSGGGPMVRVTLTKEEHVDWDRLTSLDKKMRNVRYDLSKCVFPDEEEKRVFLDLGKDHPDEVDNEEIIIEIGSDVDYSESDIETDFDSD